MTDRSDLHEAHKICTHGRNSFHNSSLLTGEQRQRKLQRRRVARSCGISPVSWACKNAGWKAVMEMFKS